MILSPQDWVLIAALTAVTIVLVGSTIRYIALELEYRRWQKLTERTSSKEK